MSTIAYKCPCCSAPLAFSCASCGNSYETDALDAMYLAQNSGGVQFDLPTETFGSDDAQAMQDAAKNSGGAMQGFMGMNMAAMSGGMNANQLFQMGQ